MIVKLVLGFQKTIGNQNVPAIGVVLSRENLIVWVMWGLMGAGALIAIPAAIADGAFGTEPRRAVENLVIGKSQGVLAARPGMTVDEIVRASTLKLDPRPGAAVISGGQVFDFRIPGSGVLFPACRYYYLSTFAQIRNRIQAISIGTSHQKLTRAERDAADAALQQRLAADGWVTGHEVYKTEEDRQLHGGLKRRTGGAHLAQGRHRSDDRGSTGRRSRPRSGCGNGHGVDPVDLLMVGRRLFRFRPLGIRAAVTQRRKFELGCRAPLKRLNALQADRRNDACELFDALTKPSKFLSGYAIMLEIAGLHVGIFELLEHRAFLARVHRPDIRQPSIQPLRLGPQKREIVHVGRVECADQQNTVISRSVV